MNILPPQDMALVSFYLTSRGFHVWFFPQIVQIAMSLRDTTTDENELAIGYTLFQERMRRGRSLTWCHEPATNLTGDVLAAPTVCGSHKGAHVEKDLFRKDVQLALPV